MGMEASEIAGMFSTRQSRSDGEWMHGLSLTIAIEKPESDTYIDADLSIEYKPRARVIVDNTEALSDVDVMTDEADRDALEALVDSVYEALVSLLFPSESLTRDPGRYCPLVVDLEYEIHPPSGSTAYISRGSML